MPVAAEAVRELLEGESVATLDRSERNPQRGGDLGMGELAKVGELDHLALSGWELGDGLANGGSGLSGCHLDIREASIRGLGQELLGDLMERPAALAQRVDGAVANYGQNPTAEAAQRGVEARTPPPDGEKRCLYAVL